MGKRSRMIRDRREGKHLPKPFRRMDTAAAVKECGRPFDKNKVTRTECKVCDMTVILHCSDCEIQITGCLCSAMERMSDEEFADFKRQIEEKKAREAGLILPGTFN